MTAAQEKLYWRLWSAAVAANDWRMVKGRLVARFERNSIESDYHTQVWEAAMSLAAQHHRSITADDLRHACHAVACGRDKSHTALTSSDFDRLIPLLKLMRDPTDIDAGIAFGNPSIGRRRRMIWKIQHAAPEAYIGTIAAAAFGTRYQPPFWEDLPEACLQILFQRIRQRTYDFRRPILAV